jgi:hypothetical protein
MEGPGFKPWSAWAEACTATLFLSDALPSCPWWCQASLPGINAQTVTQVPQGQGGGDAWHSPVQALGWRASRQGVVVAGFQSMGLNVTELEQKTSLRTGLRGLSVPFGSVPWHLVGWGPLAEARMEWWEKDRGVIFQDGWASREAASVPSYLLYQPGHPGLPYG